MRQIIKITLMLTATLLVLTACSDNLQITEPQNPAKYIPAEVLAASQNLPSHKGPVQEIDTDKPQWHERNVEAGYIFVSNDASNLYVYYY